MATSLDETARSARPIEDLARRTPHRRDCMTRTMLMLGAILLLAGCGIRDRTASEQAALPAAARPGVADRITVPCERAITEFSPPGPDLNVVSPDFDVIGDVIALRTFESAGPGPPGTAHGLYDDPTLRLASKTPVMVRRGTAVGIRVPGGFQDRVALDYVTAGPPALGIAFGPCEADTEWLVFPGYVWLANPECITLEVVLADSTVSAVRMGLGESCANLEPPGGHADA